MFVCCCPEPLWHVPISSSRGPISGGGQRRVPRQDVLGKDSPNRHSKVRPARLLPIGPAGPTSWSLNMTFYCPLQGETHYSSHSSSNTLSSNASSSHSDERWFDGGGAAAERGGGAFLPGDTSDPDPEPLPSKGGSNDSGIDASAPTHYGGGGRHAVPHGSHAHKQLRGDSRRRESSPVVPAAANQSKGYRTRTFPPPGSSTEKMDAFKPR